jgi:hypothetical protein
LGASGTAEEAAEKFDSATSAAKAFIDLRAFTAALQALRHPKPIFSAACEAGPFHIRGRTKPNQRFPGLNTLRYVITYE